MTQPVVVNDDNFESQVLQADVPVLTDFWATWCGPCKMIAPILEDIAQEYEGQLTVAKLDVDQNPETAMRYRVQSIPTLILFENGEEVERLVGAMPKERLLSRIKPHLNSD